MTKKQTKTLIIRILITIGSFFAGMVAQKHPEVAPVVDEVTNIVKTITP